MVNSSGGDSRSSGVPGDGVVVADRPSPAKDRLTQPKSGVAVCRSPSSAGETPPLPRESGGGGVLRLLAAIDDRRDAAMTDAPDRPRGVYCSLPLEKVL